MMVSQILVPCFFSPRKDCEGEGVTINFARIDLNGKYPILELCAKHAGMLADELREAEF